MENAIAQCNILMDKYNFIVTEGAFTPDIFGNFFVVFSSPYFLVRYARDRSILTVDIASNTESSNWYDMALVKALLNKEKVLNVSISVEELNSFLDEHFSIIATIFNGENYPSTKRMLEELENERSKQIFLT